MKNYTVEDMISLLKYGSPGEDELRMIANELEALQGTNKKLNEELADCRIKQELMEISAKNRKKDLKKAVSLLETILLEAKQKVIENLDGIEEAEKFLKETKTQ